MSNKKDESIGKTMVVYLNQEKTRFRTITPNAAFSLSARGGDWNDLAWALTHGAYFGYKIL
jgi:hypothetical protein